MTEKEAYEKALIQFGCGEMRDGVFVGTNAPSNAESGSIDRLAKQFLDPDYERRIAEIHRRLDQLASNQT